MPFVPFKSGAAPTRVAEVRMSEAEVLKKGTISIKCNDFVLNSNPTIMLLLSTTNFYEALFQRNAQLLIQIRKLQVSMRLCDWRRHVNYVASGGRLSLRRRDTHSLEHSIKGPR